MHLISIGRIYFKIRSTSRLEAFYITLNFQKEIPAKNASHFSDYREGASHLNFTVEQFKQVICGISRQRVRIKILYM